MPKRLLALLAALTLPLPARGDAVTDAVRSGVPQPLAAAVAARATERDMPASDALGPVMEAARQGLPPDIIAAKVLEGLSKGVPPPRIAAVARDLSARLVSADEVLANARREGLPPPADRRAALLDVGAALGAGVDRAALAALVAAAREAHGSSDGVVSGAQALGTLARQGVPLPQAMPLGLAIARRGPRPPGEIPALFEAWRAEGGTDARGFMDEAARRIEHGRALDDLVDRFGESSNRVKVDRGREQDQERAGLAGSDVGQRGADQGVGPAEASGKAGKAVPGLDEILRKKRKGPKPKD